MKSSSGIGLTVPAAQRASCSSYRRRLGRCPPAKPTIPLALAAWYLAIGLRYTADPQESITVATGALDMLTAHLDDSQSIRLRAFAGALSLSTAIYHAQDGWEGDAWRAWDQADEIVRRLPAGYFEPATVFSRPTSTCTPSLSTGRSPARVGCQTRGRAVDCLVPGHHRPRHEPRRAAGSHRAGHYQRRPIGSGSV